MSPNNSVLHAVHTKFIRGEIRTMKEFVIECARELCPEDIRDVIIDGKYDSRRNMLTGEVKYRERRVELLENMTAAVIAHRTERANQRWFQIDKSARDRMDVVAQNWCNIDAELTQARKDHPAINSRAYFTPVVDMVMDHAKHTIGMGVHKHDRMQNHEWWENELREAKEKVASSTAALKRHMDYVEYWRGWYDGVLMTYGLREIVQADADTLLLKELEWAARWGTGDKKLSEIFRDRTGRHPTLREIHELRAGIKAMWNDIKGQHSEMIVLDDPCEPMTEKQRATALEWFNREPLRFKGFEVEVVEGNHEMFMQAVDEALDECVRYVTPVTHITPSEDGKAPSKTKVEWIPGTSAVHSQAKALKHELGKLPDIHVVVPECKSAEDPQKNDADDDGVHPWLKR